MRIADLLATREPSFSFEFFPPKTPHGERTLLCTLESLRALHPTFVSVTYGAGGSSQEKTIELVCRIKHDLQLESMAHLTCIGASPETIVAVLRRLEAAGIENVLALRGDPPAGQTTFAPAPGGFAHASDLVRFIRAQGFHFCIGGAGYPEGHIESPDLDTDLAHLKTKVDAGLDFVITQLFFDNGDFYSFLERVRGAGITVPIIPGIMPVTNVAQIERFTSLCGARIPADLRRRLDAARAEDAAVRTVGIEHATRQCRDLLAHGVAGIHFYTLNQSPATRAIFAALRS
jgi:methylenetetrahydrofolate reductase (NADPH)